MGADSSGDAAPRRKRFGLPPLGTPDPATFPYRQVIACPGAEVELSTRLARETLSTLSFDVVRSGALSDTPTVAAPGRTVILAERNVRHDTADLRVRATVAILLGCGIALGALNAAILVSAVAFPAWVGIFSILALVVWYSYGRSFRSDVVFVLIDRLPGAGSDAGAAGGTPGAHTVTWVAGRVRSDIGTVANQPARRPVRVDAAFALVRVLGTLVTTFKRKVARSAGP
ncbi:MAG: hypothetical protein WBF81_03890 [Thermoplasmata archaeon]